MKKILFPLACVLALAAGFGVNFLGSGSSGKKLEITGFLLPDPEPLQAVALINQDNEEIDQSFFNDTWTLIYAGYTFCPDACPVTLAVMQQIHEQLEEGKFEQPLQSMLVSVDPKRDTPQRLKEYVGYFNPDFRAATGTNDQLREFTRQIKAVYALPKDTTGDDYLVDHSSSIVLIDPNASLHAIFTPPQQASTMVEDLKKIVSAFEG